MRNFDLPKSAWAWIMARKLVFKCGFNPATSRGGKKHRYCNNCKCHLRLQARCCCSSQFSAIFCSMKQVSKKCQSYCNCTDSRSFVFYARFVSVINVSPLFFRCQTLIYNQDEEITDHDDDKIKAKDCLWLLKKKLFRFQRSASAGWEEKNVSTTDRTKITDEVIYDDKHRYRRNLVIIQYVFVISYTFYRAWCLRISCRNVYQNSLIP